MRYLLFLLFFNLGLNAQILVPEAACEKHIQYTTKQVQEILLGKYPSFQQPIVYINYSPLFPTVLGLTRQLQPGYYIIDLNPIAGTDRLEWILIHELVHVWQLHTNKLTKDETGFQYDGKSYPFKYPYKLRPWELEAESITKQVCNPTAE